MTTAAIMISRSCAIPIAVMMESSENTMSMMMIWMMTSVQLRGRRASAGVFCAACVAPGSNAPAEIVITFFRGALTCIRCLPELALRHAPRRTVLAPAGGRSPGGR